MTPLQGAWTLARDSAGYELNGEADGLPEPYRSIHAYLETVTVDAALTGLARRKALAEARAPWLAAILATHPDRDELVKTMASVDPADEKPPPREGPEGDPGGWGPIRLEPIPQPEPFPISVLPPAAVELVTEGAGAIGCSPDALGVAVLAVASGAIGRSLALKVKDNYFASAALYTAIVGPPSDGKSPALRAVTEAVRRIDATLEEDYSEAVKDWEEAASGAASDGKSLRPKVTPHPKPQRIDVDDITMETLPLLMADNPRGLTMIRDELASLLLGMNQYKAGGKGNDRPNLIKAWSGEAIKKDRVNHENHVPVRCNHPFLTIVGGLTPDMLGSMLDPRGRADGFIDRFLMSYPEPREVAQWSERGIPKEVTGAWCDLVARLWKRSMNDRDVKDGKSVPHAVFLTPEAKAVWEERYNAHADEMNAADFAPSLRGPWGKLREYAARLALILAALGHADDPTADPETLPSVKPEAVVNAWRLVSYFKSHTRRVHATISLGPGPGGGPVVAAIVDWLRQGSRRSFSERDIKQARRWIQEDDLDLSLEHLTDRGVIRLLEVSTNRPRGGRPPLPVYEVNPALLNTQNPQNTQNPPTASDSRRF